MATAVHESDAGILAAEVRLLNRVLLKRSSAERSNAEQGYCISRSRLAILSFADHLGP